MRPLVTTTAPPPHARFRASAALLAGLILGAVSVALAWQPRVAAQISPSPQVVVAANDGMALGAISALQRCGLSVPQDVAVTGFDDLDMARLNDPPLTTVMQPLEPMMDLAVRSVVAQLRGESVPPLVMLPATLVVRESCGCGLQRHLSPPSSRPTSVTPVEFLDQYRELLLARIERHDPQRPRGARADTARLYEGLAQYVANPSTDLSAVARQLLWEAFQAQAAPNWLP